MEKLKYNNPIEVTKNQYNIIMRDFKGICAGQIANGKYFIKIWLMEYKQEIQSIIK